jgi:hypothetical protein
VSDRERIRRPEPGRTAPVRNISGVFGSGGSGTGDNHPFAWPDDPVSRAVRAGCDVVESAVRRGFGMGRPPGAGPMPGAPGSVGPWAGPWNSGSGQWTTGQWVDAMTGAVTLWAQWMDGWMAMARSVMTGGADPGRGMWPAAPGAQPAPPGAQSARPGSAAGSAAGALRLTVELRTARAVSVQLDLSSVGAALEVHGLLAPPAAAAPPITDVTVAIVDGAAVVTLGSIEHHPAGTYAGAVLAAGRACGTLTVRLT